MQAKMYCILFYPVKRVNVNSIQVEKLAFEKLDYNGVVNLVEMALKEGWNPGPYDANVFYNTDPDGFYGYFYQGELIAGGSVISYGGAFGFMGFFIVKPEYRAMGIGRRLWYQRREFLLNRLNNGAAIGMDGVVAMQPFYKKGGFRPAFRDERYVVTGKKYQVDKHIFPVTRDDYREVFKYDNECFGFPREKFLTMWLELPGSFGFKYIAGNHIKGIAVVRKATHGYKTGPLFADNFDVAETLYRACMNAVPGNKLFLDIPVANNDAGQLVKKYNAEYVFECARMYYGKAPELPLEKIYGITTFELG